MYHRKPSKDGHCESRDSGETERNMSSNRVGILFARIGCISSSFFWKLIYKFAPGKLQRHTAARFTSPSGGFPFVKFSPKLEGRKGKHLRSQSHRPDMKEFGFIPLTVMPHAGV